MSNMFSGVWSISVGTASEWMQTTVPITLGLMCVETDTGRMKIGDGVSLYTELDFVIEEVFSAEIKELMETIISSQEGLIDGNGLINPDFLPGAIKNDIRFVATAEDAMAIPEAERTGIVVIVDASFDDSVESGAAAYIWNRDSGLWVKISEMESMDIDSDQFFRLSKHTIDAVSNGETYIHTTQDDRDILSDLDDTAIVANTPDVYQITGATALKHFRGTFDFVDVIDSNLLNYDLSARAITAGWDGELPLTADVRISGTAVIGSVNTSTPAFLISTLPPDSKVQLTLDPGTYLVGAGGTGAGTTALNIDGGVALECHYTTTVYNDGVLAGGGGGGGLVVLPPGMVIPSSYAIGGGGGAGSVAGSGSSGAHYNGSPGTLTTGGATQSYGCVGGSLGQPGVKKVNNTPGKAGHAIVGVEFVTFEKQGDVRGPLL